MLTTGKVDENLKRCPRCGRPRTIVNSYSGFINIQPGRDYTVNFLKCENPKCSRKKISYLVSENPRPSKYEQDCKDEFDQLLDEFLEPAHVNVIPYTMEELDA